MNGVAPDLEVDVAERGQSTESLDQTVDVEHNFIGVGPAGRSGPRLLQLDGNVNDRLGPAGDTTLCLLQLVVANALAEIAHGPFRCGGYTEQPEHAEQEGL